MDKDEFFRARKNPKVNTKSKSKTKQNNKKSQIRKRIEELEQKQSSDLSQLIYGIDISEPIDKAQQKASKNLSPIDSSEKDNNTHIANLYVYEVDDVVELTIDELSKVWGNRLTLCGSVEAAAEVIALIEVNENIVDSYKGWQKYINHPELDELKDFLIDDIKSLSSEEIVINSVSIDSEEALIKTKEQLKHKTLQEIKEIWNQRPSSLGSLEVACEALAILRHKTNIDEKKIVWAQFLSHPAIESMSDELPDTSELIDSEKPKIPNNTFKKSKVTELEEDQRETIIRSQKQRIGQSEFRKLVLLAYNEKCCVTDCQESSLLEAAHIIPYMGTQSNIVKNGLCLRVDIHKLFDKFLISINPETLSVLVSNRVKDEYYIALHGKKLFNSKFKPSIELLTKHYSSFLKINKLV
jgi:predicted restriction endonuclease